MPLPLATAQNADKAYEAARPIPRQGHSIVHASDASGNRQRPTGRAQPQAERRAKPQEVGKGADVAPAAPEVRERGPRATKCVPPPGVASRPRGAALKCIVHRLAHKTVLCARAATPPRPRCITGTTQGTDASSPSSCSCGVQNWLRTRRPKSVKTRASTRAELKDQACGQKRAPDSSKASGQPSFRPTNKRVLTGTPRGTGRVLRTAEEAGKPHRQASLRAKGRR